MLVLGQLLECNITQVGVYLNLTISIYKFQIVFSSNLIVLEKLFQSC